RYFYLLRLLALHSLPHLCGHLAPDFIRRIFADVRNDDCYLTRLDLLRRFRNDFEQQRIDVVSTRQQHVLLRTALTTLANELVSVLEVVVAGDRFGNIVGLVEWSAVQSLHEAYLVLVDDSRIEEPDVEETWLGFITTFDRSGLSQDAIDTWREDVDLWS